MWLYTALYSVCPFRKKLYFSTRVYIPVGSYASSKQQKKFEKGDAAEVCGMCIKCQNQGDKLLFLY